MNVSVTSPRKRQIPRGVLDLLTGLPLSATAPLCRHWHPSMPPGQSPSKRRPKESGRGSCRWDIAGRADPGILATYDAELDYLTQLGASLIKVTDSRAGRGQRKATHPGTHVIEDLEGHLREWFTQHATRFVVIRPDRYVAASRRDFTRRGHRPASRIARTRRH